MKLFSIVTFSTTMSTASNVAKRSYTSNTLATDVSEVNNNIYKYNFFFENRYLARENLKKGERHYLYL